MPVEVLIPSDPDDDLRFEAFTSSLFEICAARNNNRQLADEARRTRRASTITFVRRCQKRLRSEWSGSRTMAVM